MLRTGQPCFRTLGISSICLVATLLVPGRQVFATVVANYSFSGNPASTTVDAPVTGATFSNFTRTNLVDDSQPNVFRTEGFSTSSTLDVTQYEGFSVTASGASVLTFEGITWDTNRSGQGPEAGAIRYFIDGILTDSFFYSIPTANTNGHVWNFFDFDLNPGQIVEFRFFGFDANSSDAFFTLDNVGLIEAAGPAIPEPGSLLLAMTGVVLGLGGRWVAARKKQAA